MRVMPKVYCLKCRLKVEAELTAIKMKNGRDAGTGKCPDCGTKVFKIGKIESK